MKKTLTALTVLGVCAAVPAFANDYYHHHMHAAPAAYHTETRVYSNGPVATQQSSYVEQTNTRYVRVPLTPEQIAQRQIMITNIENNIRKFDTNQDGLISPEEFAYSHEQFYNSAGWDNRTTFMNLDQDNDHQLSSQEILEAQLAQIEGRNSPVVANYTETKRVVRYSDR